MATTLLKPPETAGPPPVDDDRLDLAASLLGFQGMLFIVTAAEAGLMAALSGNASGVGPVVTSLTLAAFALIARVGLRKGQARRTVHVLQWSLLIWAAIDLALALFLTGNVLPMVGMVSRVGLPVAVLVLTRRKHL